MGVRLFSKRSLRFSHEINLDHLDIRRFNFPEEGGGEAVRLFFGRIRRAFGVIPSV